MTFRRWVTFLFSWRHCTPCCCCVWWYAEASIFYVCLTCSPYPYYHAIRWHVDSAIQYCSWCMMLPSLRFRGCILLMPYSTDYLLPALRILFLHSRPFDCNTYDVLLILLILVFYPVILMLHLWLLQHADIMPVLIFELSTPAEVPERVYAWWRYVIIRLPSFYFDIPVAWWWHCHLCSLLPLCNIFYDYWWHSHCPTFIL